jgi:hypothetical protein
MFKKIGAQPAVVHVPRVTNSTEFQGFIPNWHLRQWPPRTVISIIDVNHEF